MVVPGLSVSKNFLHHVESKDVLAAHTLIVDLNANRPRPLTNDLAHDGMDPSVYMSMATAWEMIMRADQCMRHIYVECHGTTNPHFQILVDEIVATAISSISEVGAPSWGEQLSIQAINHFWQGMFPAACNKVLKAPISPIRNLGYDHWVSTYARLSILRAAYYTIMMRAAPDIGPGLTEETRIDTALAYMA